jgi:hypothetical protein
VKTVRMTHPEVGEAEVPASAIPHWRASGWQVAEDLDVGGALPTGQVGVRNDSGQAEPVLTEEQIETPPRRRKMKEEDDGGA